jgi:hypothetical protein
MAGESKSQIPQLTSSQEKALAEGKTTHHIASDLSPFFSLRTRGYYPDEMYSDAGDALHTARTRGVHQKIREFGQKRKEASPFIKAIGRKNRGRLPNRTRIGDKEGHTQVPTFLTDRIKKFGKDPISDLTKTSLGAESQRKRNFNKRSRKKNPQSAGKRKTKRRKNGGRKKHKNKTRRRRRKTRSRRRKSK